MEDLLRELIYAADPAIIKLWALTDARGVLADMAHNSDAEIVAAARILADYGETQKERDHAAAVLALMEDGTA